MNKRDHLEDNIAKLLSTAEPELKLSEDRQSGIIDVLLKEDTRSPLRFSLNRAVKLAAAAVVLVAFTLAFVVFRETSSSAYAVEQTIKALQQVRTVHSICTDWEGKRFEMWGRINPETRKADYVCIDQTPHGLKISSTPAGSCKWDADGKVVELTNRIIVSNDSRPMHLFNDLIERRNSGDGRVRISEEVDPESGSKVIVIQVGTKLQDFRVTIDPETKLPIRYFYDRADNLQQITQSIEQINYNVELPAGMFDFKVPPDADKDREAFDAPENGMSAEGLTHSEASGIIVRKYFEAVMSGDWDTRGKLKPYDRSFGSNPPIEILDIGEPYPSRGCTGLIVPCKIKHQNNKITEYRLVVTYREIEGQPSCIIVAWWGYPIEIPQE